MEMSERKVVLAFSGSYVESELAQQPGQVGDW
jgi:hypothetical protein